MIQRFCFGWPKWLREPRVAYYCQSQYLCALWVQAWVALDKESEEQAIGSLGVHWYFIAPEGSLGSKIKLQRYGLATTFA